MASSRNGNPTTSPILAMFDPNKLPTAKPTAPVPEETTVIASSGTDVVKAISMKPKLVWDIPVDLEIPATPFIVYLVETHRTSRLTVNIVTANNIGTFMIELPTEVS